MGFSRVKTKPLEHPIKKFNLLFRHNDNLLKPPSPKIWFTFEATLHFCSPKYKIILKNKQKRQLNTAFLKLTLWQ